MLFFSALIILFLGYALWLSLLKNFTIKDDLWRAKKDRTGMISFLNKFTSSFSQLSDVLHTRDMIGFYISDVLESESLCIYRVKEKGDQLYLTPTSTFGKFTQSDDSGETTPDILINHDVLLGRVVLEKSSILMSQFASSDPLVKVTFPDFDVDSLIIVPLEVDGEVGGVIVAVDSIKADYHFTKHDLALLESLSKQVAFAHEFLDIYTKLQNQQRISKELELAEHIQNSLLPEKAPVWGSFRILPFSSAAKEVGGDYYDFVEIDEDRLLVIVADASGKGVPAGMIMTMCRSSLHALVQNFSDLNSLLVDLNSILYEDTEGCHFITMAACLINRTTNEIEYARAGHTEFLIKTRGQVEMHMPEGSALGLLPPMFVNSFEILSHQMEKGEKVLLFSDGITEACDRNDEEFGVKRLVKVWDEMITSEKQDFQPSHIIDQVDCFTEYASASDDRTIVFIERT